MKRLIILLIFIISCQYTFCQYIPYCQKGKWGFAATDGKIVIPCIYDEVNFYSDDNLAKVKKAEKYGYIDKNGVIVIPIEYDNCNRTYEVYHGKHSIGIKRKPEIHLNYDLYPGDKHLNRYIVSKNNKYGILQLIEGKTKVLVPLKYLKIQFDPNKKIFHCLDNISTKYYDTNGQEFSQEQESNIIASEEYLVEDWRGGSNKKIIIAQKKGKVGVVEQTKTYRGTSNDTIVPIIYDDIITEKYDENDFQRNDIFGVKSGKKWGIIGRKMDILLPLKYDTINFELSKDSRHWAEYHRMFVVQKKGKWGILGKKNDNSDIITTLLPFKYLSISKLYYSYLLVKIKNNLQVFSIETYNLISDNKYASVSKYKYESVSGFVLFQTLNSLGQTVYFGENGVDFFED